MPSLKEVLETMEYGVAPEADDQVRAWLKARAAGGRPAARPFINGAFVDAADAARLDVLDPSTGEVIATEADGTAEDVDAAVKAARKAQAGWAALDGHTRARYLYALARTLQKRERFFSVLESLDNGKPIRESRDIDIPLAVRHFYHHAGWAEVLASELGEVAPLGVCGQVIPWNFPLLMLAWKVAPALAAGNTVVLKPAESTPMTAVAFAEICAEVGLPPGVFNLVTGAGGTGAAIVTHSGIDKVAFTGSTEVGRIIREATAGSGKKLSLELGGKSPFIVFDDADIDSAVEGIVDAIWFNQGQVCCAGSRLLVQESIADAFHDKLRARADKLRVGSPLDKSTDIGAIVDAVQLARITRLVEEGTREGATCWQPDWALPAKGFYHKPTLLSGVAPASKVAQEEIFGPVLVSMTFRTQDEAIALANNTRYGLAASVWSETLSVALDAAARIKAGVVWINGTNMFDAAAGFGGYRESGFGREGGREGMLEYLKPVPAAGAKKRKAAAKADRVADFSAAPAAGAATPHPAFDRTAKLYIGGKQARPDGGASYAVRDGAGRLVSQAGLGNRKDIRNAVEAAQKAAGWSSANAHARAQVIYFLAENLEARADEFAARITRLTGAGKAEAAAEVDAAIRCLSYYAGYADKFDGRVHSTRARHVTLAMNEPWGVMGIACPDEAPLAAFLRLVVPAVAMGNRVIVIPSQTAPLIATDLYQVLETSDVPAGVINIVTGERSVLSATLADHDDVDAFWAVVPEDEAAAIERRSAGNLKATWVSDAATVDWSEPLPVAGPRMLQKAVQVKNIWVPYGE